MAAKLDAFRMLKQWVPEPWRGRLRKTATRLRHAGFRHRCNICGFRVRSFLTHGLPPDPNFLCPVCRSKPPHRLAKVYFDAHPEIFAKGGVLLHVAPEQGLGGKLEQLAWQHGMQYRGGGITGAGDRYIDLFDLPFGNSSIALIYCCHVLNSLQDDHAAMREVFRVLHPEGLAILQVPAFYEGATTLEATSVEERRATFGDEGVFRCYTNDDYEARLRSAGFEVSAFRAGNVAKELIDYHQLKREVLHLCSKPREVAA